MNVHSSTAEIDLDALTHNINKVKAGSTGIIAVVKADAYGHGAAEVSRHLISNGISRLGVAFVSEAIELRESGIECPILVFFDRDNIETCLKYNLTPVIFDLKTAKKLSAATYKLNRKVPVHIKVDTGMGRVGLNISTAADEITEIAALKNLELEGLMSHFADADLENKDFAEEQLRRFTALKNELELKKIIFNHYHIANSAAVLTMPEARLNMVRPGIMLYGYAFNGISGLRPVMTLKSSIVLLKKVPAGTTISYGRTFTTKRESIIATISAGYADGYSRMLSNKGAVLIAGKRAPIAGRVCMDTIMADVTDIPEAGYESEVVLIGKQGEEIISAQDIAEQTGTIPYEVLTSIGRRVKRIYK